MVQPDCNQLAYFITTVSLKWNIISLERNGSTFERGNEESKRPTSSLSLLHTKTSVSYTHLDEYANKFSFIRLSRTKW